MLGFLCKLDPIWGSLFGWNWSKWGLEGVPFSCQFLLDLGGRFLRWNGRLGMAWGSKNVVFYNVLSMSRYVRRDSVRTNFWSRKGPQRGAKKRWKIKEEASQRASRKGLFFHVRLCWFWVQNGRQNGGQNRIKKDQKMDNQHDLKCFKSCWKRKN